MKLFTRLSHIYGIQYLNIDHLSSSIAAAAGSKGSVSDEGVVDQLDIVLATSEVLLLLNHAL